MLLTLYYIAILLLILIFDVRQRRVLNVLALPATLVAIIAGWKTGFSPFLSTLLGASVGLAFFYAVYRLGRRRYGAPALGFGDVKLAMLLGAILGLRYVLPVLSLGMLLAGAAALFLLLFGHGGKQASLPYGAYLATAGIAALIWVKLLPLAGDLR